MENNNQLLEKLLALTNTTENRVLKGLGFQDSNTVESFKQLRRSIKKLYGVDEPDPETPKGKEDSFKQKKAKRNLLEGSRW